MGKSSLIFKVPLEGEYPEGTTVRTLRENEFLQVDGEDVYVYARERPVIFLRGNARRPDQSHFLRPPKLVVEGALHSTFSTPKTRTMHFLPPHFGKRFNQSLVRTGVWRGF